MKDTIVIGAVYTIDTRGEMSDLIDGVVIVTKGGTIGYIVRANVGI